MQWWFQCSTGKTFWLFSVLINVNPALQTIFVLIPIPTPSFIEFVPFSIFDFQFVTHPLWFPTLELWVKFALVVGDVFRLCVGVSVAIVFCAMFATHLIEFFFVFYLLPWLFDQQQLLLCPFGGGGMGELEVDGDGNLRVVFFSILRWYVMHGLCCMPSSCCQSWHRLFQWSSCRMRYSAVIELVGVGFPSHCWSML
jgi:hypothetical protein